MKLKHITFLLLLCCVIYLIFLTSESKFVTNSLSSHRTNFLILGTDFVQKSVHSDTVLFVSYSPKERILDIISIPRDTYINLSDIKYKKLTDIYAYLYARYKNHLSAGKKLAEIISDTLLTTDFGKIKIDYCIVINYQGFIKLINTIGKIKIYVDQPMHYDDFAGDLHIHFEPGEYEMDGEQLLKFVRYRESRGDIPRMLRQQQVIRSIMNKFFNFFTVVKIPVIFTKINECIFTDLNLWEIFNIMVEFRNLKIANLRFSYFQGKPYKLYWQPDKEYIEGTVKYLLDKKTFVPSSGRIIKVYNATNVPKLALKVTKYLRNKGYDVLTWDNWSQTLPESKIIDYCGDISLVEKISSLLGISNISCFYNYHIPGDENIDLKIILGEDFFSFPCSVKIVDDTQGFR